MKNIKLFITIAILSTSMGFAQSNSYPIFDYVKVLETDVNDLNSVYLTPQDSQVDSKGNLYIIGDFNGSIDMDPSNSDFILTAMPITNGGDHPLDMRSSFIGKYSPSGNLIWAYKLGKDSNIVKAKHLSIDKNDNLAVSGEYKYNVDFDLYDTYEFQDAPDRFKEFVVSYKDDASFRWVNEINPVGSSPVYATDIAFKSNGRLIVTGDFNGQINFPTFFGNIPLSNSGALNSFFAEINSQGYWTTARHIQSNLTFQVESLVIDSNNNLIFNISERNGLSLKSHRIRRYNTASVAFTDILTLRPDVNTTMTVRALSIDSNDQLYLGGYLKGNIIEGGGILISSSDTIHHDGYLLKVDNQDNVSWTHTIPPVNDTSYTQYFNILKIDVDDSNRILIGGSIKGTYQLGNNITMSASDPSVYNIFVSKFNQSGNAIWGSIFQKLTNSPINTFSINNLHLVGDQFYMFGRLTITTDFDLHPFYNTNTIPAYSDPDVYFAKYDDVEIDTLVNEKRASGYSITPTLITNNIRVQLELPSNTSKTVKLYDLQGVLHLEKTMTKNDTSLDLSTSEIPSGIYIVNIYNTSNEIVHSEKIIKK